MTGSTRNDHEGAGSPAPPAGDPEAAAAPTPAMPSSGSGLPAGVAVSSAGGTPPGEVPTSSAPPAPAGAAPAAEPDAVPPGQLEQPAGAAGAPSGEAGPPVLQVPKTKVSATWVAVGAGLLLLLLVIIFVGQNQHDSRLNFLWWHGNVPVGLAILLAFVIGGLVVLLLGVVRLTQLRLMARRHRQADDSARTAA